MDRADEELPPRVNDSRLMAQRRATVQLPVGRCLEVLFLRTIDPARNPEFQKVVEGYAVTQDLFAS